MSQFGNICRHHWKERLKISKIAKFESDTSQASEDIANQSLYPPPYKRPQIKFRHFEEL